MLKFTRVLMILAMAASARGADRLEDARGAVNQWVEARQLISKTSADWQSDKEILEQTIKLFERELKSIEEQMAKSSTNNAQVDKERLEAEALKATSTQALDQARQFAGACESQFARLVPQLPQPLQELLKPLRARIPDDPARTRLSAAERIQVIVGVLNEIDKFNNAVSIFTEKRTNEKGEEVAVETVYVGTGAAYFVNEANDFAGSGTFGLTGWEWKTQSELAAPVREVIRTYRNERPAKFVSLPAVIR